MSVSKEVKIIDLSFKFEDLLQSFKNNCLRIILAVAVAGTGVIFLRNWLSGGVCDSPNRLDGKTVIITGGNTGIGKETAKELARRGARVIIACRDILKGERAADEILLACNTARVSVRQLDLASLWSVRSFANIIIATQSQLHVLINNAGVMYCPKWRTQDGFEMHFGVNHLGHFLLTLLLLDLLKKSAPSRVINVSSLLHRWGKIHFDDINLENDYSPMKAYTQSKLANILFTQELARRLRGTGVSVFAVHPGVVKTELTRHAVLTVPRWCWWLTRPFILLIMKTPEEGAQTSVYCAVADIEDLSGHYFSDCSVHTPAAHACNEETAAVLWNISLEMISS